MCLLFENLLLQTNTFPVSRSQPTTSATVWTEDGEEDIQSYDLSSCVRSPDLSLRTWSFGVLELWCVDALSFVEIFSRQFFQVHFKISLS